MSDVTAQRDLYQRQAEECQRMREENERLRGEILKMVPKPHYDKLHLDFQQTCVDRDDLARKVACLPFIEFPEWAWCTGV